MIELEQIQELNFKSNHLMDKAKELILRGRQFQNNLGTLPPNTMWLRKQRGWLYERITPLSIITFWSFFALLLLIITIRLMQIGFGFAPSAVDTQPPPDTTSTVTIGAVFIFWSLIIALGWWRWVEYLFDQRWWRWWGRLILFLAFACVTFILPSVLVTDDLVTMQNVLLAVPQSIREWTILWAIGVLPSCTFIALGIIHILAFIRDIIGLHNMEAENTVQLLTAEQGSDNWSLLNATENEISIVKNWAQNKREGAEKTLIPLGVGLAIFAVMIDAAGNFETLKIPIDNAIAWCLEVLNHPAFSLEFVLIYGLTIIGTLILWQFTQAIWSLFTMIIAQNLVIEACSMSLDNLRLKRVEEEQQSITTPVVFPAPQGFCEKLKWLFT